jgi:tetratricopeptide (TPR) repeat protein
MLKALEMPSSLFNELEVLAMLVDAAAEAGDRQVLKEYLARMTAMAEALNHRLYLGIALRGHAALHSLDGDAAAALDHAERSLEIIRALGLPYQLGRCHAQQAGILAAMGRNEEARQAFQESLESFAGLRATLEIEKTRQKLEL